MGAKKLITPYCGVPTVELREMKKVLVIKGNVALKKSNYLEASMIKEDLDMINLQIKINKEEGEVTKYEAFS